MPTTSKYEGFSPLQATSSRENSSAVSRMKPNSGEYVVDIPLTPIRSNVSTGARKASQFAEREVVDQTQRTEMDEAGIFRAHIGRRRMTRAGLTVTEGQEDALTTMGRFYEKVLNFSVVTRYLFYILPLALCFLIVILVSIYAATTATIGGVKMVWFFVWLEIVWCSLWASKLVAKMLPLIFQVLVGVVSSGVKKYSLVIKALEVPLSLVGWAIASLGSFLPLMVQNHDLKAGDVGKVKAWEKRVNLVLIAFLISSLVFLAERLLIQIVSVDYHRRQFAQRIDVSKANVRFLSQLYEVSRSLFPENAEFAEEDALIRQGIAGGINIPGFIPGIRQSGSATPMRQLVGNFNMVQDKVASAFGNIAQEVTGNKNAFNPNGAYAIVIDALQRKKSSEALAKRIWLSFVPEGSSALTKADLLEVMTGHEQQAAECFESLDRDENGDVSLDEMLLHVMNMRSERFDVAKSMQDVDNAIRALDNVLMFIVFVIVVLVFVVAQQESIGTVVAGAGTVLISLSFVFATTAQEILGSCIFLFVKHPYDVGDRVDISSDQMTVDHISLLYTVLRRVDNGKSTQIPNVVLNNMAIENITRSKSMTESLTVSVSFGTTLQDIQKLKEELLLFVRSNNRDFQPELDVAVKGIGSLDKLDLRIDMNFKGNWANQTLTMERRNKFICALVLILKKIPIYGPGGGDPTLGEQGKPSFSVAVSQEQAERLMKDAVKRKAAGRWDYEDHDSDSEEKDPKHHSSSNATTVGLEVNQSAQYNMSPFESGDRDETSTLGRKSSDSRREDIEEVRTLLSRASTKGRRKAVPAQSSFGTSQDSLLYAPSAQYPQTSVSAQNIAPRGSNY